MTNITIIKDVLSDNATPIGVLDSGETFGLKQEDRKGNMCLFGRPGTGKSALIENIIVSDIVNGRGGLLIDPFGELTDQVLDYENKNNVIKFEVAKGYARLNIDKFDKEIDLSEIKRFFATVS